VNKIIALVLSSLIIIQECLGASCCGSSISMPALISTGERWKFQTVLSDSERVFQITGDSDAIKLSDKNQLNVFKSQIKSGYRFDNDWQVFTEINYFDQGMGDIATGVGKELKLSDEYNTFVWAQLTAPTGRSVYQINNPNDQITGTGFWTPGVGLSFFKTFGTWDGSISAFAGHGLETEYNGSKVMPGWQTFGQIAIGKSFHEWRLGGGIEYQRENGRKTQVGGTAEDSYSWPVSLSISYLDKSDIWTASYFDETLLGPTKNTYLNHGVSVSYVHRFF
jgi:hypothetical protein